MFRFRLDGASGVPPYLQLVHQVRQSLLLGYLREGDRLPTVKDVAGDLAINPNTRGWRAGGPGRARSSPAPCRLPPRTPTTSCGRRWRNGSARPMRPGSTMRR